MLFLLSILTHACCACALPSQLGNEPGGRPIATGNHHQTDSLTQFFDSKLGLVDSASSNHGRHLTGVWRRAGL